MTDTELLDVVERNDIRLVKRPGAGGGWQWVAYNNAAMAAATTVREAILAFLKECE